MKNCNFFLFSVGVDINDPPPARRLNIARLIMLYVKKFEITNPLEALHYYFSLRNLLAQTNQNLFMVCISDLAQETRAYDLLFGKMQPNGIRTIGLVDQFIGSGMSTENLCEMVAQELHKKGLYEDAVKLYDLADNQEEVLILMSVLLSQVVNQELRPGSQRERLGHLAQEYTTRYSSSGYKCSAPVVSTFKTLRDQMFFFDQFHSKQYELAKETLMNLKLIPLNMNEVSERVVSFKRLSPEVCKIIPDLLLAAMTILFEQYKNLKNAVVNVTKFDDSNLKVITLRFGVFECFKVSK